MTASTFVIACLSVVVLVLTVTAGSAHAACVVNGKDISALTSSSSYSLTIPDPGNPSSSWTFYVNFCQNAQSGDANFATCAAAGAAPIYQLAGSSCKMLGSLPACPGGTPSPLTCASDDNSATLVYANGTTYSDGTKRAALISLVCAKDAGKPNNTLEFVAEATTAPRYYSFKFYADAVCKGAPPPPPPNGGGGSGISGGSIFLIIFFCGGALYVAVGMLIKWKFYQASGCDLFPNTDFWKNLPGLVWDGIKFTFTCGRAGYSRV